MKPSQFSFPLVLLMVGLIMGCASSTVKLGFDENSWPSLLAPLNWDMSDSDIRQFAKGGEISRSKYPAGYFEKYVQMDAVSISKADLPQFSEASVTVEKLNGRIVGIRIGTTETNQQCLLHYDDRPKGCRTDDLEGLKKVFSNVLHTLEKQYGSGIRLEGDFVGEQFIKWTSQQGELVLYLAHNDEHDIGWSVGLRIIRR